MFIITTKEGGTKLVSLSGLYKGASCILVGGAPSISDKDLSLLSGRGIVSAAMNNVAVKFRPNLWFSGDRPECFDPVILGDPGIMKFAPHGYQKSQVLDGHYGDLPNMIFYAWTRDVPQERILDPGSKIPFYRNTMLAALAILYRLGFVKVFLFGCDLQLEDGEVYSYSADVGRTEQESNARLYGSIRESLIRLKPVFDQHGFEIVDASVHSSLSEVYPTCAYEEAVDACQLHHHSFTPKHNSQFLTTDQRKKLGFDREVELL